MTTTISGDSGLTFPNSSTQSNSQVGMKNRVIDGGYIINQRGYVSGTALSAGSYAHDRWKAGSGGCTYTFTQGSLGVNTTITITAGSLQQVIEGCNLPEGGTYTLSWTGTAQARFNGGSYGSSPLAVTGITAGANTTIEFNTGTVGSVQLEVGSSATSFDYRSYGTELALCQRYYERWTFGSSYGFLATGQAYSTTAVQAGLFYTVQKRAGPTISTSGTTQNYNATGTGVASTYAFAQITTSSASLTATTSGMTAGNASLFYINSSNGYIDFSSEL